MVRSWQKRVEAVEARRTQAKQRKLRSEEKKLYKGMVQELFALLDRHGETIVVQKRRQRRQQQRQRLQQQQEEQQQEYHHHKRPPKDNKRRPRSSSNASYFSSPPVASQNHTPLHLHIWTDTVPSDSPPFLDLYHREQPPSNKKPGGKKGGGRPRSCSVGSAASEASANSSSERGKKSRDFHGSLSSEYGEPKKAHPRSKQQQSDAAAEPWNESPSSAASSSAPWLCKSQFFSGRCDDPGGGKRGGGIGKCRCFHYPKQYKTLAGVLSRKKSNNIHNNRTKGTTTTAETNSELALSEAACAAATPEEIAAPGAMEMVYYSTVALDEEETPATVSDLVMSLLSSKACVAASIVYLAVDDTLLFDRNRNGLILSEDRFLASLNGDPAAAALDDSSHHFRGNDSNNNNSTRNTINGNHNNNNTGMLPLEEIATSITGPVLEHVLSFLSDSAVASASRVCRSWHREIGQVSPHLWRHMLSRRNWPMPSLQKLQRHRQSTATTTATAGTMIAPTTPTPTKRLFKEEGGAQSDSNDNNNSGSNRDNYNNNSRGDTTTRLYRDEFISHYTVLRDVKALQMAMVGLLAKGQQQQKRSVPPEKEMTFQAFSARGGRGGAPQPPNCCVSVEVWAPNHVLAAYSHDCTLHLFQAVPSRTPPPSSSLPSGSSTATNEKFCKEVMCQRIDPYKHTKKKSCRLVSMRLDEDVIGCLCHVMEDHCDAEAFKLVIISRDDFLLGDCGGDNGKTGRKISEPGEGALSVIDIRESVLHFLLSCCDSDDTADQRFLQLHDFLATRGDFEDVEVIVSQSMASCGYGRFLVEVAISIPIDDNDYDDDNDEDLHNDNDMLLIDRKLFLFSSSVGAIVWMGNSNPAVLGLRPRHEDMTLACLRERPMVSSSAATGSSGSARSRTSCTLVVASLSSHAIMTADIDPSGFIEGTPQLVEASTWVSNAAWERDGWETSRMQHRPMVITPTDFVVADVLTRGGGGGGGGDHNDNNNNNNNEMHHHHHQNHQKEYKSILTFFNRYHSVFVHSDISDDSANASSSCDFDTRFVETYDDAAASAPDSSEKREHVPGFYTRLIIDGNCQVVRMVRFHENHVLLLCRFYKTTTLEDADNNIHGGGHWGSNPRGTRFTIQAIVVHVPTRRTISEPVHLLEDTSLGDYRFSLLDMPIRISVSGNTVAGAMWWKGVMMTGKDVRSVGENSNVLVVPDYHNAAGSPSKSSSKKKKKKNYKGERKTKKDGFARGMTFYG